MEVDRKQKSPKIQMMCVSWILSTWHPVLSFLPVQSGNKILVFLHPLFLDLHLQSAGLTESDLTSLQNVETNPDSKLPKCILMNILIFLE